MFQKDESESLQDCVFFSEECFLEVFGIGLGYYPEEIKNIFNKSIWSINPFIILKALVILIGNTEKNVDNLQLIALDKKNIEDTLSNFTKIVSKYNSYQKYKKHYGFLDGLPLLIDSLDEIQILIKLMNLE